MADTTVGPRLGIDWGKARIGVAASNRGTTLAYPVETVQADAGALRRIGEIVAEYEPGIVYVGLPLTLKGERSFSAQYVLEQVAHLGGVIDPGIIRLVDERMSTSSASRNLGRAGQRAKQQRSVIDQAAAVEILQRALDLEISSGQPAGEALEGDEA